MKNLSMTETKEIVETIDKEQEILSFIKKFAKMDRKKTSELRKELESLEIMKIKAEHTAKIIDLLPEDVSDINKIFTDTSLDENEINKILGVVKKYK